MSDEEIRWKGDTKIVETRFSKMWSLSCCLLLPNLSWNNVIQNVHLTGKMQIQDEEHTHLVRKTLRVQNTDHLSFLRRMWLRGAWNCHGGPLLFVSKQWCEFSPAVFVMVALHLGAGNRIARCWSWKRKIARISQNSLWLKDEFGEDMFP